MDCIEVQKRKGKSILCSRQNERRERENEKWDQNKELKMKLLIGLRFMFGFVPIFHLPVNRARFGCCFVFSVNLLLFLPFSLPCVFAPSSSSLLKLPFSLLFTISAPFTPNSLKMFSV